MSGKRALITGITGQDGSYLAELLLDKGYEVHGMVRRASTEKFERIEHLRDRITLHQGDLLDHRSLVDTLRASKPDEVYNLAAMSFVGISWIQPTLTAEFTGVGVTRLLECIREVCPDVRFYQASSSEMFGKVLETPQTETTPFYPRSPYGVAKVYGHHITVNYRESYDMFLTLGDPLQPRVRAPRARVRHAQGHLARGGDQARPARRGRPRQPRRQARLGLREGLRRGDVADAPARQARRLRDRDRRDQHGPAAASRSRSTRPACRGSPTCASTTQFKRPGRGRPAGRRRLEGRARAGLEAEDELRAADPADGRRRPEAAAGRVTDDPTGWFEPLYAAAERGEREVPWDRGEPRELLVGVGRARARSTARGLGALRRRLRVRRRRGVPELSWAST